MMCMKANRLLMQFHITGRCNLRCKHCYRTEGDVEPLGFDDVINVIEQYKSLRLRYNDCHGINAKGQINLTGGEPFVREDVCDILDYMGDNRDSFSFGILTNGSFIDDDTIQCLRKNEVSFVQLSIDGDCRMHDNLRAPGDYERTFKTASLLEKSGIITYISFTANTENYKYLPTVAKECRRLGITKLWSDRLVPIGTGSEMSDLTITRELMDDYIGCLKKARGGRITKLLYPKTQVTMNRALQFLNSDGNLYSCSAGDSLVTVDEFGNVMPCRRMPVICGNVSEASLEEIYFESDVFKKLRQKNIPEECRGCIYDIYCRGGARCQSYAAYGDFNLPDPACNVIKKECK